VELIYFGNHACPPGYAHGGVIATRSVYIFPPTDDSNREKKVKSESNDNLQRT